MNSSEMPRSNMVIAVDGPSGSGKSSISRQAAIELKYRFLDTGAMYRSLTWLCLNKQIGDAQQVLTILNHKDFNLNISTDPEKELVEVNNVNITDIIRNQNVTENVSKFAANPEVRKYLVDIQREIVSGATYDNKGIVVEGRDIGSVVLPNADKKIFITASEEARASRRAKQMSIAVDEVLVSQKIRDDKDSNRKVSPLVIADKAIVLDNSELNFDESVNKFIEIVSNK